MNVEKKKEKASPRRGPGDGVPPERREGKTPQCFGKVVEFKCSLTPPCLSKISKEDILHGWSVSQLGND